MGIGGQPLPPIVKAAEAEGKGENHLFIRGSPAVVLASHPGFPRVEAVAVDGGFLFLFFGKEGELHVARRITRRLAALTEGIDKQFVALVLDGLLGRQKMLQRGYTKERVARSRQRIFRTARFVAAQGFTINAAVEEAEYGAVTAALDFALEHRKVAAVMGVDSDLLVHLSQLNGVVDWWIRIVPRQEYVERWHIPRLVEFLAYKWSVTMLDIAKLLYCDYSTARVFATANPMFAKLAERGSIAATLREMEVCPIAYNAHGEEIDGGFLRGVTRWKGKFILVGDLYAIARGQVPPERAATDVLLRYDEEYYALAADNWDTVAALTAEPAEGRPVPDDLFKLAQIEGGAAFRDHGDAATLQWGDYVTAALRDLAPSTTIDPQEWALRLQNECGATEPLQALVLAVKAVIEYLEDAGLVHEVENGDGTTLYERSGRPISPLPNLTEHGVAYLAQMVPNTEIITETLCIHFQQSCGVTWSVYRLRRPVKALLLALAEAPEPLVRAVSTPGTRTRFFRKGDETPWDAALRICTPLIEAMESEEEVRIVDLAWELQGQAFWTSSPKYSFAKAQLEVTAVCAHFADAASAPLLRRTSSGFIRTTDRARRPAPPPKDWSGLPGFVPSQQANL